MDSDRMSLIAAVIKSMLQNKTWVRAVVPMADTHQYINDEIGQIMVPGHEGHDLLLIDDKGDVFAVRVSRYEEETKATEDEES